MKLISLQTLTGFIVLSGFMLNFAFTVTPTKTQAVFGNQDDSYRRILDQESGAAFMSNSLGLDLSSELPDVDAEKSTGAIISDSVVAEGLSLLPSKHK